MIQFSFVLKWFYPGSVELHTFAFQGNVILPSLRPERALPFPDPVPLLTT